MPLPKPDVSNAKIEVVSSAKTILGEGPHWDDRTQKLLWVDIYGPSVFVYDPATGENKEYNLRSELERLGEQGNRVSVGVVVPIRDDPNKLLIGTGNHVATLDMTTGKVEFKCEYQDGSEDTRFNDGKCDPVGRFWVGSMDIETGGEIANKTAGNLYRVDKDFAAPKQEVDKIAISNGLAWTEDHKTMYYIDSVPGALDAFDYDIETGCISNRRTAVTWDGETGGSPDGMTIDSIGRLWVAGYFSGRVMCCDPTAKDEKPVFIQLPEAKCITSCCFGGKNLDELYVTCASKDDTSANAGKLFRITNIDATGTLGTPYSG